MGNIEEKTYKYYQNCNERHYDHPIIQAFSRPKIEWIKSKIGLSGKKILEVGAGNGYFSNNLISECELTVLDTSEYQLRFNPAKQKHIGSVYKMPFQDNSFDIVFCSNLLHHLKDSQRAVLEMKRVAKNFVIILEPNRNNPILFIGALFYKHERKAIKYSKKFISNLIKNSKLKTTNHTFIGGLVMPNLTPLFILPIAMAKSKNLFSFFQIFICKK